jgi:hypothetical protein
MARTDRGEIGGGVARGSGGRGRVGSSTYGTPKPNKPLSSRAKKTIQAKEDLPYKRVTRALEGKEAYKWKPATTGKVRSAKISASLKKYEEWFGMKPPKTASNKAASKMEKKVYNNPYNEPINTNSPRVFKKSTPPVKYTKTIGEWKPVQKVPVKKKGK